MEISKIEKTENNSVPKKKLNKKQHDPVPKFFNLGSHKQD